MQGYLDLESVLDYQTLDKRIKTHLKDIQNKIMVEKDKHICRRTYQEHLKAYCSTKEMAPGAIASRIEQGLNINLHYNEAYIPQSLDLQPEVLLKILMHGDNNPHWNIPQYCSQCKQHNIRNKTLHKILQCPKNKDKRKEIFSSIITELNHLGTKYYGIRYGQYTIIPHEAYNQILDASITGSIKGNNALQQALTTLIGGNISINLTDIAVAQVTRMMIAHLYLLINVFTNRIYEPEKWTQLPDNTTLATEDLEAGKIVTRVNSKGITHYMNIREKLEQMTIPQLQNYNIGLGAAGTRTRKQKELAKIYTEKIINQASNNIIFVDGSINTKDNKTPAEIQKIQQTGYGGYGGIHITKRNNQIHNYFWDKINTNDAQKSELQGIYTALKLAHQIEAPEITILCDCKNAVKYSNKQYHTPYKYAKECQNIYAETHKLWAKNKNVDIKWIPGHTGNKWNDIVDRLAKKAAKTWVQQRPNTSQTAGHLPFLRALNSQPIRFSPIGETG